MSHHFVCELLSTKTFRFSFYLLSVFQSYTMALRFKLSFKLPWETELTSDVTGSEAPCSIVLTRCAVYLRSKNAGVSGGKCGRSPACAAQRG